MPPAISGSARINANDTDRLVAWLIRRGLEGMAEPELLPLFCEKCGAAGLPINRALIFMDTLHPVHEGRIFRWRNDGETEDRPVLDYGPSNQGEAAASWQRSPSVKFGDGDACRSTPAVKSRTSRRNAISR